MRKPTSAERRRVKRALRKAQDKHWAETMGSNPDHGRQWAESNIDLMIKEAIDLAPRHMIDEDAIVVDKAKCANLTRSATQARSAERELRIAEIRLELPDIWGVRGKAKEVADEFFKRTGERWSVRTIQNYFRLSRR